MNWFSTLSARERMITLTCALVVLAVVIVTRALPAYRGWVDGLLERESIATLSLERTRSDVAHADSMRDSIGFWRQRIDSAHSRPFATLDALQAAAIETVSDAADSVGLSLESVHADAYSADATRTCAVAACARAIFVRASAHGDTEQTLAFVMALRARGGSVAVTEVSIRSHGTGTVSSTAGSLEAEFTFQAFGTIDAAGLRTGAKR